MSTDFCNSLLRGLMSHKRFFVLRRGDLLLGSLFVNCGTGVLLVHLTRFFRFNERTANLIKLFIYNCNKRRGDECDIRLLFLEDCDLYTLRYLELNGHLKSKSDMSCLMLLK